MQKNIHGPPLRPGDLEPNSRSIRVSFLKAPNMPPTAPPPPRRGKNQWAKSSWFFRWENGEPKKTYGDLWGPPCFFKESRFRMLLIWSLFCGESFYIMWCVLKWFDMFHFVWMYFEHVWTCFDYFSVQNVLHLSAMSWCVKNNPPDSNGNWWPNLVF